MVLFIFEKDCILDLNLLHVNKEGNGDVEVEVFLEDVPVEFMGCLSPCEGACGVGPYEGFGLWILLVEPLPQEGCWTGKCEIQVLYALLDCALL